MAYGMGKLAARGPAILRSGWLIPFIATACASSSNLAFTRINEIFTGVTVVDHEGKSRGVSKTAGIDGVTKTALSRCVLVPAAVLMLPSFAMSILQRAPAFPKSAGVLMFTQTALIYGCIQAALPAALAVFPPRSELRAKDLEPEFHGLVDSQGQPVDTLFASKGL
jgi:hypothetical protein